MVLFLRARLPPLCYDDDAGGQASGVVDEVMGATVSQDREGSRLNIQKDDGRRERDVSIVLCWGKEARPRVYILYCQAERVTSEKKENGWVGGGYVGMLGRSAGRSEVGGGRQVDGFGLGWVGWRQTASSGSGSGSGSGLCVFISSFFIHRVQRWWWDERERKMNTFFYRLVVGTCVCREEKKVIFLLFVSPGGGESRARPVEKRGVGSLDFSF